MEGKLFEENEMLLKLGTGGLPNSVLDRVGGDGNVVGEHDSKREGSAYEHESGEVVAC